MPQSFVENLSSVHTYGKTTRCTDDHASFGGFASSVIAKCSRMVLQPRMVAKALARADWRKVDLHAVPSGTVTSHMPTVWSNTEADRIGLIVD